MYLLLAEVELADNLSMKSPERSLKSIFLSIIFLSILSSLIYFFPPNHTFTLLFFKLPIVLLFLISLFLFIFYLILFLFKSPLHAGLISLLGITSLIFKLNNIDHPFFFILLAALFLMLELFFSYKK